MVFWGARLRSVKGDFWTSVARSFRSSIDFHALKKMVVAAVLQRWELGLSEIFTRFRLFDALFAFCTRKALAHHFDFPSEKGGAGYFCFSAECSKDFLPFFAQASATRTKYVYHVCEVLSWAFWRRLF